MRKNETAPRYLESGSDEDTPGTPGLEVRSRPWGSGGGGKGSAEYGGPAKAGRRPHGERGIGPHPLTAPSGQAALTAAERSQGAPRSAPRFLAPGGPGHARRAAARRPARDAAARPGGRPPRRRPARSTLACSRAGAQARQVQVPLRCAEGTYSWCSRLLAVSHTRKWPSLEAKAK